MSNYENLTILVSLISAFVALWAIIVSRKTAEQQKNIAQRTQLLESRNLIATHHGKYSDLLFSVQNQTKKHKEELSEAAYIALHKLCILFHKYGVAPSLAGMHQRQTRHIFHEVCEQIYKAFSPHLAWQNGTNLRIRYYRLRDIDSAELTMSEIEQLERDAKVEDIQLAEACRENINEELENRVVESYKFRFLVQQLLSRISPKDRPLIFQEALQELAPYFAIYEKGEEILILARNSLEDALAQNELEEFSLKESATLLEAYKKELARLETLQDLDLTDIRCLSDIQVKDAVPELIYIGSVLYTISMCRN